MTEPSARDVRLIPCPGAVKSRPVVAMRTAMSLLRRAVPSWRTARVDLGGGIVLADLTTPYGLYLYRVGFPEREARLLRALLRPGDVFVDGGAHIGTFTLIAAGVVGVHGRVVACEPSGATRRLLERNVEANGFRNVEILPAAIAERPGTLPFVSFSADSALGSFAPACQSGGETTTVRTVTLDEIAALVPGPVRMVKLDIEGAEVRALRGAEQLLRSGPDFLIEVEPDHLARQGGSVGELQSMFEAAGYVGYAISERPGGIDLGPLRTWSRPAGNPNIFVSRS